MKYVRLIFLVILSAILLAGCASGRNFEASNLKLESPDDVLISKAVFGKGESYMLWAKVGEVYLTYWSSKDFKGEEIESFRRMTRRIKQPKFQEFLKESVKRDIPLEDQNGYIFKSANEPFWEFRSQTETIYYMVADTKDEESLLRSRWSKIPPTRKKR